LHAESFFSATKSLTSLESIQQARLDSRKKEEKNDTWFVCY